MGMDGAKLSKRHGGTAVEEYRKEGFLPEALVNYLLLLGWSPGDDREIMHLDEAVKLFDIDKMKGVQAKFDVQKLRWMNGEYIMRKTKEELLPLVKGQMSDAGKAPPGDDKLLKVIELYKPRMKTLSEFIPLTDCFFSDAYAIDEKGREKHLSSSESKEILRDFTTRLEKMGDFSHKSIEEACRVMAEEKKVKAGQIIHPTRMAISGMTQGAGLFEMMETLGKDKVIERMKKAAS